MPELTHQSLYKRHRDGVVRVGVNVATIAGIESLYDALLVRQPQDRVSLPTQARRLAAGGEAALIQWLATWISGSDPLQLQTFATEAGDIQIERFARRLYGQVAALCCRHAYTRDGRIEITQQLQDKALQLLKESQGPHPALAARGQSLELLCVDHIGLGAPQLLYEGGTTGADIIRDRTAYREVASQILEATTQGAYRRTVAEESKSAIAELLYEIFKNTEDHAKTTLNQDELPYSVRGLIAKKHDLLPTDLVTIAGDFEPLRAFCARLTPTAGRHQVHLLEISVFDSGIGYAERWTNRSLEQLTDQEEYKAVSDCFLRGTTKSDTGFGEGLPHVVRLLKLHGGFLRLRTGRLSLVADMSTGQPFSLSRWVPNPARSLQRASGALVTILLPLRTVA